MSAYTTNKTTISTQSNNQPHWSDSELVFSIETLRAPLATLSKLTRAKFEYLKKLHNKIDDEFLSKRVEPRYIVIVPDGLNMKSSKSLFNQKKWENRTYSNVKININKYIAKYDYSIGNLICQSAAPRNTHAEKNFPNQAIFEILEVCSRQLSGGSKIFQSLWGFDGVSYDELT